jgi:hypothetical protein
MAKSRWTAGETCTSFTLKESLNINGNFGGSIDQSQRRPTKSTFVSTPLSFFPPFSTAQLIQHPCYHLPASSQKPLLILLHSIHSSTQQITAFPFPRERSLLLCAKVRLPDICVEVLTRCNQACKCHAPLPCKNLRTWSHFSPRNPPVTHLFSIGVVSPPPDLSSSHIITPAANPTSPSVRLCLVRSTESMSITCSISLYN